MTRAIIIGSAIIGASIVCAMALYLYFSPFRACVRSYMSSSGFDEATATNFCAARTR